MKITFYPTVAFAFVTCAMFATSCANDVETDTNIDPVGNAISFSPSVGHTTRATETTISNLGNFAVVARPLHHDGAMYDNFLIGSKEKGGEIVKRYSLAEGENPTSGTWILDRSVYWPSSMENVLFFAYTALQTTDLYTPDSDDPDKYILGTNNDGTQPSFGFVGNDLAISGFKPLKADLNTTPSSGIWADGENQKDLLVAFTEQARATSATNVNINFEHALTQVSITAIQNGKLSSDHRIVKIKGAWIVNAAETGKLTGTVTQDESDKRKVNISNSWSGSSKTTYGAFYTDIIQLNSTSNSQNLLRHSLMLVPESLTAWNKKDGTESNGGAYIMLLCRVELEHEGDSHTGTVLGDIAIENGKHYHQLFPVNEAEFNGAEYGFVCVPLSSDWSTNGIGKHYTYNLNICGNGTGAGFYPPKMTEDDVNKLVPQGTKVSVVGETDPQPLVVTTTRPSNKNVGDNVLDDPIQFTVTVSAWEKKNTNWTEGTGSSNS